MVGLRIIAMAPMRGGRIQPASHSPSRPRTGHRYERPRASPRTSSPAGRSELAARLRHLDLALFMAPEQSGRARPKRKWSSSARSRRPLRALRSAERGRREDPRHGGLGAASTSGDGCARRRGSTARESQPAAGVKARPLLARLSGEEYRGSSNWPRVQDVSLKPEGHRSALAPRRGAQGQRLRRAGPAIRALGLFPSARRATRHRGRGRLER